ncbi:MAG: HEAT repeat domain-containing protein [Acidobacteriota bacterium]|nr:MAG: HEAT repeat domain-containing protein [Acidobacteriota bacterium]
MKIILIMIAIFLTGAQGQEELKALPLHPKCEPSAGGVAFEDLRNSDPLKRLKAVEAVYRACDDRAIDALIDAIADPDWRVRAAVGRALCSFQISRAGNAALNTLVNPSDHRITDPDDLRARCLTILAINQLRDVRYSRKAIGFLFSFLDLKDEKLRRIAEETAEQLKYTRNGYHELVAIVRQHNYPDFRRKAAIWLGTFPEAVDVLAEVAAGDRDESVRRAAGEALERMKR